MVSMLTKPSGSLGRRSAHCKLADCSGLCCTAGASKGTCYWVYVCLQFTTCAKLIGLQPYMYQHGCLKCFVTFHSNFKTNTEILFASCHRNGLLKPTGIFSITTSIGKLSVVLYTIHMKYSDIKTSSQYPAGEKAILLYPSNDQL